MDIAFYKVIHMLGLVLLFQSLGASLFYSFSAREPSDDWPAKMLKIMHGTGLLLLLLGGFGMLAKLGIMWPLPVWTWIKLLVWITLAASLPLVKKKPESARIWWTLVIVLGALAAYLGAFKPF